MIGRDVGSIFNGDLFLLWLFVLLLCWWNGLVDIGKRDVFYGEDDVVGLMFRKEELE